MRLLEIKGPGEFSLVQVAFHTTLSYAILSHTWTDGQEVTYQDLISGAGSSKSGYDKIKFCGEQAARDGLQYFWVDTCCIDKSDADELTTAINSMFRWYRSAKKCYVYLADVSILGCDADVQARQCLWEAAFRNSRWFNRGWTLQELIAPAIVEFFSKEGKRLGDKQSLEKPIQEITGIPIQALRGNPFSDFNISERIGWAARRQTTKEEDIVYCLLGLCEVSMPPIYGEGKEVALKRLHMTVKGFSNNTGEPKDLEEKSIPFIVPFDKNPNFTGRGTQLAQLEGRLFIGEQTNKVAITGLGGVGKTQLVLALVYQIRDKYKNCSVIWIPATNMESLHQAYLNVARQLSIAGCEEEQADVKRLVQSYLSKESAGQWLLVFDNADDINMWISEAGSKPGSGRLIEYLPRSEQGCIVFTSRDRKMAVKLAHQNIVEVPEMDKDVATQLLRKCLINPDLLISESDTTALLKELTYLPLAIVQAAAYINENGITFSDYLSLLADQEEEVIDLLSEDFEDDWRYHSVKNPVATTWLISFEQIRQCDTLAAEYLSFMSCVDPKDIPQSLLPPGPSRKKEIDAIGTLNAYSFISKRPANLALDLHRLVHLSTRNWLRKEKLLTPSTEKVILRLEEVLPDKDYDNRSVWRTYLPHARYVLESNQVDKECQSRMDLVWRYGMCLYEDGRWNEAEAAIAEVLEIEKRDLGADHPSTLISIANLAETYAQQGRQREAEIIQTRLLKLNEKVLGAKHPNTLLNMNNLATNYTQQGRWKEAENIQTRLLELNEKVLGAEHPNALLNMINLAANYSQQGRGKEAEDIQTRLLELNKKVLGAEHPNTLINMNNLAHNYAQQGEWKEAENIQTRLLELNEKVLGAEHPNTLLNMSNLATNYLQQGQWKEAEDIQTRLLEMNEKVLGAEHPNTIMNMQNLAANYSHQGRWKEAEDIQTRLLRLNEKVLGAEHPNALVNMQNLAANYSQQGRWKEAEDIQTRLLELNEKVLGAEHPNILLNMNNLANNYTQQGRWKEAEDIQTRLLELNEKVLGAEHPNILLNMHNLANNYTQQGRWKEAEDVQTRLLKLNEKVLGAEHPNTIMNMQNLAANYSQQGRWKEAEDIQTRFLELNEKVLGAKHPNTLLNMANLANNYTQQGRWKEAEDIQTRLLELNEKVLSAKHPNTLLNMINLANNYTQQGRWKEAEDIQTRLLELNEKVLGAEHPNTLLNMANLAHNYSQQEQWKEAEELFIQVIETSKRVLGADHPNTLVSMSNLALTYIDQSRWDAAEELGMQVLEASKRVLGTDHPNTLTSMNNLAFTWKKQGRDIEALKLMEECLTVCTRILGNDHPDTLSSRTTLLGWQTEALEISDLA